MKSDGIEDEEKWLAEGIASIQHNAFYMHRALVHTSISPFVTLTFPPDPHSNLIIINSQNLYRHRTRTISGKSSSTPHRCSLSFELRSFHRTNTTNSVTIFPFIPRIDCFRSFSRSTDWKFDSCFAWGA